MATAPIVLGTYGEKMDLQIRQGATFGPFLFDMKNPGGSPVDLTGCTIKGQLRRKASDALSVCDITALITNAALGQYEIGISAEDTMAMKAGETIQDLASKYVWDLELHDAQSRVIPLYYGTATVFREVTRG